jgi:hypothetical protein
MLENEVAFQSIVCLEIECSSSHDLANALVGGERQRVILGNPNTLWRV